MAKRQPQLDLPYHRTIRAPSADERLARYEEAARERREGRASRRAEFLARPVPPLPTPEEIGVPVQSMRPESARAARLPIQSLHEALADLVNRQSFHGSWLAQRITMGDGVRFAERAVLLSERVGWIKRGNYDPSPDQQFFGLGGFAGNQLSKLKEEHRNALCFHWITVTTKWLEPDYVRQMLIGGGVL